MKRERKHIRASCKEFISSVRYLILTLFLLVPLVLPLPGFPQHPLYYSINDENGLPSNEIYEVVQDHFGLIWVASNSGLFSYDGVRVHRFSNTAEKNRGMTAVTLDGQDKVWCRNARGQVFKAEKDSLKMMYNPSAEKPVRAIAFDQKGGFCAISGNRVAQYNTDGIETGSFELTIEVNDRATIADAAIRKNKLYSFVVNIGICEIDLIKQTQRLLLRTEAESIGGFNFKGNELYLMVLNQHDQSKQIFLYSGNSFQPIFSQPEIKGEGRWLRLVPDGENRLWICTDKGVFSIIHHDTRWEKTEKLFEGMPVSSVMEDEEGIQWFSTLSEGFLVMPDEEITYLLPDITEAEGNNLVSICVLPGGEIVAGNSTGKLFSVHPRSFQSREIFPVSINASRIPVKNILPYKNGLLISRGSFSYGNLSNMVEVKWPTFFARDAEVLNDTLYAAQTNGILKAYIHPDFHYDPQSIEIIHPYGGNATALDPDSGEIYFACSDGTYYLKNGKLAEVLPEGNKLFLNLLRSGREGVWAAGPGTGLMLLRNGQVIRVFGTREGLPDLNLRALCCSGEMVYFSTEKYFCRLNTVNGEITSLSSSIGFNPNHINDIGVSDGKIWLATSRGIISLPFSSGQINIHAPPVRIREILLDGKPVSPGGILKVPGQNTSLRIEFEGISFRSRNQYYFEYRIASLDTGWTRSPGEANFVSYPSLPPGDYTFEVRTVDENGTRSNAVASFQMQVASPFYQKAWFIVLAVAVASLLAYLLFRIRLGSIRRKHEIQKQLIHSQLTAIKAQMNPHFMFNALNSIQDFVISKDIRNSNLFLGKFSTLMRKVLDASDHNLIRLSDEIEMLRLYLDLEQLRFGAEMQYVIETPHGIDTDDKFIPSMVIQPFVENAVKHGLLHKKGEKRLTIQLIAGSELTCIIRDNGIGRKRSAEIRKRSPEHTSFSTIATVKRLDLIQSLYGAAVSLTLTDLENNGQPEGTEVRIKLPFMNPEQPLVK